QGLYKLSIYRPQILGQARNDVYLQKPVIAVLDTAIYPQICKKDCHVFSQRILPREQAKVCDCHPERRTVTLAKNRHAELDSASVQTQHLPSTDSGSSPE
ncbi:MAG: hypothetical protein II611_08410, partial [Treponema sp.]|nr:hypothetical protein [Treponema sp.]